MEIEYQNRLNSYSTIKTNFYPTTNNGNRSSMQYPLFFISTNQINDLSNRIIINSRRIKQLANELPYASTNQYLWRMIDSEINYYQMGKSKSNVKETEYDENDFTSVYQKYNDLMFNESFPVNYLINFRELYYRLFTTEIPIESDPDGILFRDKPTSILKGRKKVYTPPNNEKLIKDQLLDLLNFQNDFKIPFLSQIITTYFMFENIHPFNDGNGRLGLYLVQTQLANQLDIYTASALIPSLMENNKRYLELFLEVEDIDNRSDVTVFITEMLNFILNGQNDTIGYLYMLIERLSQVKKVIHDKFKNDLLSQEIMSLVGQSDFFKTDDDLIPDKEIIAVLKENFTQTEIKAKITDLEAQNYLIKIKKRPLTHMFNLKLPD